MTIPLPVIPLPAWPDYGLVDDLLPTLTQWCADGKRAALATLIKIEGSSPRPLGSEMAISDQGDVVGYVSGGCVEAAIAQEARACLLDGHPRLLDYGAGSPVLDIQLTCGGRITILVRPVSDLGFYILHLASARQNRQPITVRTEIRSGIMRFMDGAPAPVPGSVLRLYEPPTRLVLAGGDPVTLGILHVARTLHIETTLLRPLGPPDAPANLMPAHYDRRHLGIALETLKPDRWTAIYALTHEQEKDLQIAEYALRSAAFCVGILGSRRKIATRVDALRQRGIPEEALSRLHLPAGLDIEARTPVEIALSVIGQVIALRNSRSPALLS